MFFKGLIGTIIISALFSVLAVFINRDKVESDLISRVNSSLSQFNQDWSSIKTEGRDITVSGKSPLMAMRQSALDTIKNVSGVRVVADLTTVKAKASRYEWSATRNETGFVLKGHVPSPELRADILEKAKLISGGASISDKMEFADGAPEEGWANAIEFGLVYMDSLKTGTITIDENAVRIEGEAVNVKSHIALTEAFKGGGDAPDGYILASNVSAPRVSDFRWSAIRNNDGIVLEGYAPGEDSREEIEAMAFDISDGASVDNRLKLASGEPADWEDRITFAIDHLKALKSGEVRISNSGISVSGEAATNKGYDAMQKMQAPDGVSLTREISRPVVAPFIWSASLDQDNIVLAGYVPGEASRKALLEKAGAVADGRKVIDEMEFAAGAPEGWGNITSFALDNLGLMKTGEAKLTDSELLLKGMSRDEAALAAINSANAPAGGKLTADITAPPNPEPEPVETEESKAEAPKAESGTE